MSCFVVNESGRSVHVTLDHDEDDFAPNRYNLIISKDALDKKRHLERFQLQPNRRRQVYCMLEPFTLLVTLHLPSAFWLEGTDDDGANLVVVRDLQ